MLYVLIPLVLLLALVLSVSLYAFLRGSTRRDRTELFRASTVAPSGRYKYRDRVQLGVDWYESQPKTELTITSRDGFEGRGVCLGLSYGKAGGKCVHLGLHIKQEADGPEESCPVIL